jgi:hypothetical protein
MTYGAVAQSDSATHDDDHPARNALPQNLLGAIGLAVIASACGWTLYANLAGTDHNAIVAGPTMTIATARPAPPTVAVAPALPAAPVAVPTLPTRPVEPVRLVAPRIDITLLHRSHSFNAPPTVFSLDAPVRSVQRPETPPSAVRGVLRVPLPTPRPAGLGSPSLLATAPRTVADDPFQKLFGKREGNGPVLAYAAPDGGIFNNGKSLSPGILPPNDGLTAIYDITARTVYLPDGTKLEAHSGLGPKMDDPRHVHVKMHGATPPHVYDLVPREALFHGVQALRLIPVGGESAIFGRTGLLTHTYLLGPRGDSNGCISFRDYDAFLRAYENGKVKRMVVVASVNDPQLDLRIVERRPEKTVRTETVSFRAPQLDDRYLPAFSSSLASRTNSSARSLN